MALAHVKFIESENFGYSLYLLRDEETDRINGLNLQLRQHRWYYILPWKEYGS
jgi:hypothetical protein